MFPIKKSGEQQTYWYPVPVPMIDDNGKKQNFTFDGRYKRLPVNELQELMKRIKEGIENKQPIMDAEVIEIVFDGWRKVSDIDTGKELEESVENREVLLSIHPVPSSIVKAWMKSLGWEGRLGN
jgi:hypothetical protein